MSNFETLKNPPGRIMKISPVLMYSHRNAGANRAAGADFRVGRRAADISPSFSVSPSPESRQCPMTKVTPGSFHDQLSLHFFVA